MRDRTRKISSFSPFVGAHDGQDAAAKIDVRWGRGESGAFWVVVIDLEEEALGEQFELQKSSFHESFPESKSWKKASASRSAAARSGALGPELIGGRIFAREQMREPPRDVPDRVDCFGLKMLAHEIRAAGGDSVAVLGTQSVGKTSPVS